jgi:carboxypeptidase C (cathepsin A)
VCNFIGNYRTVQGLDWSGAKEFVQKELREWKIDGKVAGETKTEGRLTFVTMRGAGHMVRFLISVHYFNLTSKLRRRSINLLKLPISSNTG